MMPYPDYSAMPSYGQQYYAPPYSAPSFFSWDQVPENFKMGLAQEVGSYNQQYFAPLNPQVWAMPCGSPQQESILSSSLAQKHQFNAGIWQDQLNYMIPGSDPISSQIKNLYQIGFNLQPGSPADFSLQQRIQGLASQLPPDPNRDRALDSITTEWNRARLGNCLDSLMSMAPAYAYSPQEQDIQSRVNSLLSICQSPNLNQAIPQYL